jgi:hypothetical protein
MKNDNIIDKAFDVFTTAQRKVGSPVPDEVSFVGGFIAAFGIIVGRVDVGLDQNAPLTDILDLMHRNIHDFGRRVVQNRALQDGLANLANGKGEKA